MKSVRPTIWAGILVGLIVVSIGTTSGVLAQPQRRGLPAPQESVIPAAGVQVPMLRFHRLPLVEVTIDGKGPFRMIVDTGAAGIVLRQAVAEQLKLAAPPGLPAGLRVKLSSPGGAGVPAAVVYIEELQIGAARFAGVWTVSAALPFGEELDGVIGMNMFKECLLTFDYPQKQFEFQHGALAEANGQDIVDYTNPRMPESHPVIDVDVAGEPVEFFIDTGMHGWFAIDEETADQIKTIEGPVPGTMGLTIDRAERSQLSRLDATFRVGGFAVNQPTVRLAHSNTVGTFFLENFAVTFDAKNKRMRLAIAAGNAFTPPPVRDAGFSLRVQDDQMVVWDVHPDSHAARVGIASGDVVLELNGEPAREMYESSAWADWIQNEATARVKYQPSGAPQSKEIELEVLQMLK